MKIKYLLIKNNPLENLNNLLEDFSATLKTITILLTISAIAVIIIHHYIRNKR